ncbi:hypothetical protein ACJX0J_036647, partial [Zea mays]
MPCPLFLWLDRVAEWGDGIDQLCKNDIVNGLFTLGGFHKRICVLPKISIVDKSPRINWLIMFLPFIKHSVISLNYIIFEYYNFLLFQPWSKNYKTQEMSGAESKALLHGLHLDTSLGINGCTSQGLCQRTHQSIHQGVGYIISCNIWSIYEIKILNLSTIFARDNASLQHAMQITQEIWRKLDVRVTQGGLVAT